MTAEQDFTPRADQPRPAMPAAISAAIVAIMAEVTQISYSAHNKQGGYDFASIDDFMEAVRPLLAKHKLVVLPDEESWDIRPGDVKDNGQKGASLLAVDYSFTLSVGASTWGYRPRRTAMVYAAMGAQAFGAAQSYAEKLFLRGLFKISTGEPDADGLAGDGPREALPEGPDLRAKGQEAYAAARVKLTEATSIEDVRAVWRAALEDKGLIPMDRQRELVALRDSRIAELRVTAAAAVSPPPPASETPPLAPEPDGELVLDAEPPGPETPAAPASPPDPNDPFGFDALEAAKRSPKNRPGANRPGQ